MSSAVHPRVRCPVCRGTDLQALVRLPGVPLFCHMLVRSADEALAVPRGDIDLAGCRDCGHVFNRAFDAELLRYGGAYENSLHFSRHYQRYAEETADRLIARYGLAGRTVLEIGCGRGDFLRLLCGRGGNRGFGFDPSHVPVAGDADPDAPTILARPFTPADLRPADLVASRHVLEHLSDPTELLALIREAAAMSGSGVVFIEVPNGLYTLDHGGIWDLIYEHVSYFTPASLAAAMNDAGLAVRHMDSAFGGQFLWVEAVPADEAPISGAGAEMAGRFTGFPRRFAATLGHWRSVIGEAVARGERLALWGGGSKGVTFLNLLGLRAGEGVDWVVDINPRKAGAFVPGTGQPIVPPERLRALRPDHVVIMNPEYRQEIVAQLSALGLDCPVLVVTDRHMEPETAVLDDAV